MKGTCCSQIRFLGLNMPSMTNATAPEAPNAKNGALRNAAGGAGGSASKHTPYLLDGRDGERITGAYHHQIERFIPELSFMSTKRATPPSAQREDEKTMRTGILIPGSSSRRRGIAASRMRGIDPIVKLSYVPGPTSAHIDEFVNQPSLADIKTLAKQQALQPHRSNTTPTPTSSSSVSLGEGKKATADGLGGDDAVLGLLDNLLTSEAIRKGGSRRNKDALHLSSSLSSASSPSKMQIQATNTATSALLASTDHSLEVSRDGDNDLQHIHSTTDDYTSHHQPLSPFQQGALKALALCMGSSIRTSNGGDGGAVVSPVAGPSLGDLNAKRWTWVQGGGFHCVQKERVEDTIIIEVVNNNKDPSISVDSTSPRLPPLRPSTDTTTSPNISHMSSMAVPSTSSTSSAETQRARRIYDTIISSIEEQLTTRIISKAMECLPPSALGGGSIPNSFAATLVKEFDVRPLVTTVAVPTAAIERGLLRLDTITAAATSSASSSSLHSKLVQLIADTVEGKLSLMFIQQQSNPLFTKEHSESKSLASVAFKKTKSPKRNVASEGKKELDIISQRRAVVETLQGSILPSSAATCSLHQHPTNSNQLVFTISVQFSSSLHRLRSRLLNRQTMEDLNRVRLYACLKDLSSWWDHCDHKMTKTPQQDGNNPGHHHPIQPAQGFGILAPWRHDVTIKASAFDNIAYFSHSKTSAQQKAADGTKRGVVTIAEQRELEMNLSEKDKQEALQLMVKIVGKCVSRRMHISGDSDFFTVVACPSLVLEFTDSLSPRTTPKVPKLSPVEAVPTTSTAAASSLSVVPPTSSSMLSTQPSSSTPSSVWPWMPTSIDIHVFELLLLRRGLPMGFVLSELKEDLTVLREDRIIHEMCHKLWKACQEETRGGAGSSSYSASSSKFTPTSSKDWERCYADAHRYFVKHVTHLLPTIEISTAATIEPRSISCQRVRIQGVSEQDLMTWMSENGPHVRHQHEFPGAPDPQVDSDIVRKFCRINNFTEPHEVRVSVNSEGDDTSVIASKGLHSPSRLEAQVASQGFLARTLRLPKALCPSINAPNGILLSDVSTSTKRGTTASASSSGSGDAEDGFLSQFSVSINSNGAGGSGKSEGPKKGSCDDDDGRVFGGKLFQLSGSVPNATEQMGLDNGLSLSQSSKLQGGGAVLKSRVKGRLFLIRKYSELSRVASDDRFWASHYFTLYGIPESSSIPFDEENSQNVGSGVSRPRLLYSMSLALTLKGDTNETPSLFRFIGQFRQTMYARRKEISKVYTLRPSHMDGFHIDATLRQIPPSHVRRVIPSLQLTCGSLYVDRVDTPRTQRALFASADSNTNITSKSSSAASTKSSPSTSSPEMGTGFINYFGFGKFSQYSFRNQHVGLHLLKGEFKTAAAILMNATEESFRGSFDEVAGRHGRTSKERREHAKDMDGVVAANATSGGGRLGSVIRQALRSEASGRNVIRNLTGDSTSSLPDAPNRYVTRAPPSTSRGFDNALVGLSEGGGAFPSLSTDHPSGGTIGKQGGGLEFVTEDYMRDIFIEFVGIKACMLLIQEFLSFVWNEVVSMRVRRFGARTILPGDLVINSSNNNTNTSTTSQQNEDGDIDMDLATSHPTTSRIRPTYATSEDILTGRYTYRDVVMPLPGYFVALPDNDALASMYTNCLKHSYGIEMDAESDRWEVFGKGFGWYERFVELKRRRQEQQQNAADASSASSTAASKSSNNNSVSPHERVSIRTDQSTEASATSQSRLDGVEGNGSKKVSWSQLTGVSPQRSGNALGLVVAGGYRRVFEGPQILHHSDIDSTNITTNATTTPPPCYYAKVSIATDDSHSGEMENVRLLQREAARLSKWASSSSTAFQLNKKSRGKHSHASSTNTARKKNTKSIATRYFAAAELAAAIIPAQVRVEFRLPSSSYPSSMWREVTKLQRNSWEDVVELRTFIARKQPNIKDNTSTKPYGDDPNNADAIKNDPKKFDLAQRMGGLRVEDLNANDRYLYNHILSKKAPMGRVNTQGSYALYQAVLHKTIFRGGISTATDLMPHNHSFNNHKGGTSANTY